jgi:hypothetical protein
MFGLALGCNTNDNATDQPDKPTPASSDIESILPAAKQDLAQRLDVPVGEIVLVSVADIEWSNTSLGCPESGSFYAQVITPGYIIILSFDGKTYEYHSDTTSAVVYCPELSSSS